MSDSCPNFKFSIYENTHSIITLGNAYTYSERIELILEAARYFIKDELGISGRLIGHTIYIMSTEENLKKLKEAKTIFALQNNVYLFTVSHQEYTMELNKHYES